jgi:hypothetical protein
MSLSGRQDSESLYTVAFNNWQQDIEYSERMAQLQAIVENRKLSRRRRREAWQRQSDLHRFIYGADLDTDDDRAREDLDAETDPGNSSVSEATDCSLSGEEKELLWEWNMMNSDPNAHDKFPKIVRDRQREKRDARTQQKKEMKRASLAKAAAEKAARDKAEALAAFQEESRMIAEAVKKTLQHLDLLLGKMNFFWNPDCKFWENVRDRKSLFQNKPSPSEAEILKEIGQTAWNCILQARFSQASFELKMFQKDKEAEDRSSRFSSSLFDSDADDES